MSNSNLFFESLFNRKLSAPGTRDFLTHITGEYPYFSPAQFFLLLLTEKERTEFKVQAAKTSILFNNPYWLQFQLQEKQVLPGGKNDVIAEDINSPVIDNNENKETARTIPEGALLYPAAETEEAIPGNTTEPKPGEHLSSDHENNAEAIISENEILPPGSELPGMIPPGIEPAITTENEFEPVTHDHPGLSQQENENEIITGNDTGPSIEKSPGLLQPEKAAAIIVEKETEQVTSEPPGLSEPGEESAITSEKESNPVSSENTGSAVPGFEEELIDNLQSGHFNKESTPFVNETEEDPVPEPEIEPLNFKLTIETPATTGDNLLFEPLHTTDYFASLGIKLSAENKPADRLGKQLKSFTEWLKTMKKIHGDQLTEQSGQNDISIQKLAEQSNKEAGVVTEAMAEVLLHQGKAEKAMEVYEKLSLLNPSKSAYFAAKIDQLKEH